MGDFTTARSYLYIAGNIIDPDQNNINENNIYTAHNGAFHQTTGHRHTGAVGDGPILGATSIDLTANYSWTGDQTFNSLQLILKGPNTGKAYFTYGNSVSDAQITFDDPGGSHADSVAYLAASQTLYLKTLVSPVINTQMTLDQASFDYTMTWADPSAARALQILDPGVATATFAFLEKSQTWGGTQTFTNKITGSISGNCDGSSGSTTGNAAGTSAGLAAGTYNYNTGVGTVMNAYTAASTSAVQVGTSTTNYNYSILWSPAITGAQTPLGNALLQYNPVTDVLSNATYKGKIYSPTGTSSISIGTATYGRVGCVAYYGTLSVDGDFVVNIGAGLRVVGSNLWFCGDLGTVWAPGDYSPSVNGHYTYNAVTGSFEWYSNNSDFGNWLFNIIIWYVVAL